MKRMTKTLALGRKGLEDELALDNVEYVEAGRVRVPSETTGLRDSGSKKRMKVRMAIWKSILR